MVRRDIRFYGSGVQIFYFVMNMVVRTLIHMGEGVPTLHQHRMYIITIFAVAFYISSCGYVPDRAFYQILCPCMVLSWLCFHYLVGYLHVPSILMAGVVPALMGFMR